MVPLRHKDAGGFRRRVVVIAAGQIDTATMAHYYRSALGFHPRVYPRPMAVAAMDS